MTDPMFIKRQRKTHLTITGVWFLLVGIPLLVGGFLRHEMFWGSFLGLGLGLFPPLLSTLLNWNDTSRYT